MRLAWALGIAAALCYALLIYQIVQSGGALSGPDAALDVRMFGYSPADAEAWLTGLDPVARDAYFGVIHKTDTAFPVLLGAALSVFLWQFGGKWTIAAPIAYAALDLMENATIRSLPDASDFAIAAQMASELTVYKFTALALAIAALIWAYRTRRVL